MNVVFGLILLFMCVFGVFLLQGGNSSILIDALPAELAIILGSGIAALIIANRNDTPRYVLIALKRVIRGPKWSKKDNLDTIVLVYTLLKTLKTKGPKSIEEDIENPFSSKRFLEFPLLCRDKHLILMISDTLRVMVASTGALNPYAVEELMDARIAQASSHERHAFHALRALGGGLPALGIVACVLGIVKTMASIDEPPAVLGSLIGAALLGTFLGVFLAYGIVDPLAKRISQHIEDDAQLYYVVKQLIVASLHSHPEALIIESARVAISPRYQPTFDEVFDAMRNHRTTEPINND